MPASETNGMSQAAVNTQPVRAAESAACTPPGAPFPGTRSGTTGAPNAAYGAASFATTSAPPSNRARNSLSERAAMGSPPTRRRPFGRPAMRVARPPARSAPVQSEMRAAVTEGEHNARGHPPWPGPTVPALESNGRFGYNPTPL